MKFLVIKNQENEVGKNDIEDKMIIFGDGKMKLLAKNGNDEIVVQDLIMIMKTKGAVRIIAYSLNSYYYSNFISRIPQCFYPFSSFQR